MVKGTEHYCQVKKEYMERLTYLTEFFELENYGINLCKEFGDDVKESLEAMMKMLDKTECTEDL